jgi:hypothetical protein
MSFDQPQRPSPSIVPTPQQVAAYLAKQRARVIEELTGAQPAAPAAKAGLVPRLISGTANTYAEPEWVWPDRIARGKLTVLGGAPGSGKSTLLTDIIARVTTGAAWPCQEVMAPKGAVC